MIQDRALLPKIVLRRVICDGVKTAVGAAMGTAIGAAMVCAGLVGVAESRAAPCPRPVGPPAGVGVPDVGNVQDAGGVQDAGSGGTKPSPDASEWAFVQGVPIGDGEVRFLLGQVEAATTGQRALLDAWLATAVSESPADRPALPSPVIQAAVEQWIERLVVLAFLERNELASSPERVTAELELLDKKLREQGSSLEAYCEKSGIRRAALERHLRWELSWNRYVTRRVTDDSLKRFYERYPAEFDGRRRRLAHIVLVWGDSTAEAENVKPAGGDSLIPPPPTPWPRPLRAGASERIQTLEQVRRRIVAGELTFAEAAARHSQGASAADGGDLGWTLRTGPLSEAVSQAAFRLKMGEISLPIVSPHGVHLLAVLDEEPGQRSYEQVKEQVKQVAIRELWQALLQQEAPRLSIEFRPPGPDHASND